MKKLIMILLLAMVSTVMAAEIDGRPNADRYIADEIKIEMLPSGEIITRLVSNNGITARQFWINSVYQQRESLVVFHGRGGPAPSLAIAHRTSHAE